MNLDLGDTRLIIAECKKSNLLRNQVAYVLATAYWETARTVKPVIEYGGHSYLRRKKYFPYYGRGYVQLTWLENYKKASKELGVDFVACPEKLLEPEYAVVILVTGMKEGWFTGRSLEHYVTLQKSDFVNARRIVNGVDKRHKIAKIAETYDDLLKKEGYGEDTAPERPTERPVEVLQDTQVPSVPKKTIGFLGGLFILYYYYKDVIDAFVLN